MLFSKRLQHILPIVALTIVILLLSLPTLRYGYLLEDYKYLRSYSFKEIANAFHSHWEPTLYETKGYRPLHSVHYAFFHLLIGGDPLRNHLLQILLLLIGVFLIYSATFRWTKDPSSAFWAALIYPCLSTTAWQVSWLNHRHHLLQVILFLICLIYYDRYLNSRSKIFWSISFVSFVLALLMKEAAVTFPLIVLCFAIIVRGKKLRSQIKALIPFFLLLGLFLLIRNSVIKTVPEDNIHPPFISLVPKQLIYEYSRSLLGTLVQSQGISDPNNDFPIYDSGFSTPRDYIGLLAAIGFFCIAGTLIILSSTESRKRTFLFGLAILLIATVLVAVWYRINRLFISSIGVAIMAGVLLSGTFQYLSHNLNIRRLLIGLLALFFLFAFLAVNLSAFFQIQWALRPNGFLALTWDKWAYEEYIYWIDHSGLKLIKKEQIRIFEDKLRRTGRMEWADKLAR